MFISTHELEQLLLGACAFRRNADTCELAIPFQAELPSPLGRCAVIYDRRLSAQKNEAEAALASDQFAVPLVVLPLSNGADGWAVAAAGCAPAGAMVFSSMMQSQLRRCLPAFAAGDVVLRQGRTTNQDRFVAVANWDSEEGGPVFRSCSEALGFLLMLAAEGALVDDGTALSRGRAFFASQLLEKVNSHLAGDVWRFEYHAFQLAGATWRRVAHRKDSGFFGWRTLMAAVEECLEHGPEGGAQVATA